MCNDGGGITPLTQHKLLTNHSRRGGEGSGVMGTRGQAHGLRVRDGDREHHSQTSMGGGRGVTVNTHI